MIQHSHHTHADHHEEHRKATWLELFYDLIFVVAISKTAHVLMHAHHGHIAPEIYGKYILIMIPVVWVWIGHTMFANRFDCEDPVQRVMTLAQMFFAIVMSAFISPEFDENFRGFLFSYMAMRVLIIAMYMRASLHSPETRRVSDYLATVFALGAAVSFSSLFFEGSLRYVILYGGIVFEMIMPIWGRKRLATMAVHSHHLTERYGLMTIILLGESVISLVSSFEDIHWAPQTVFAGICGFLLAASLWWIYFENMEHHIAGRNLRHGQMITYPHFMIYAGLGGIAAMIRFALLPEITLLDYKIMASFGILLFILTEQYFCFLFHPKKLRSALIFKAWLFNVLFLLLIAFAPSVMTVLVGTTVLLVAYAELTRVKEI